jgi:hypothetical protein
LHIRRFNSQQEDKQDKVVKLHLTGFAFQYDTAVAAAVSDFNHTSTIFCMNVGGGEEECVCSASNHACVEQSAEKGIFSFIQYTQISFFFVV